MSSTSAPGAPTCSVVIPTYNAARTIDDALSALAEQSFAEPFEVVVVDNNSTDGSAGLALRRLRRLPHLRVVDASRAQGVAAARNDGIRAAGTDVILICDADDVADRDWMRAMVTALASADYVGGALETTRLNAAANQEWVPVEPLTTALPRTWHDRPYAFGGNLGMRRTVFDAAGGFDETYGAGAEEIDFAWRAAEAGYTPVFVAGAVIHYRLRTDLRGVMRQQYHSGLGTAQLYATVRPAGVPGRRWHRRLRHELALLRAFPWRGDETARGTWCTVVAFEAGKVRGSIRHRCAVP